MKKITQKQIYKRQTTLQEIGKEGQQKLLQTKVVIVGCGGLGNATAVYLAASGVGYLHLVDFDTISACNLHRQVFYKTEDIGKPKVEVLANHIQSISPFVKISTSQHPVVKKNVFNLIAKADYILDCTDSLPIKYLLNDACVLKDKPLIYGSLYKFDGYVSSFNIKNTKGAFSTNLRDAFPDMPKQKIPNCSEVGTLNTIVGIIGLMQANEVLKLATETGKPLINELLIYNSLENSQFKMKLKQSFTKDKIEKLFKDKTYYDANCEIQEESLLISAKALRQKLLYGEASRGLNIISVIEDTKTKLPFQVHRKIPLSALNLEQEKFTAAKEYIIVCNKGISSYIVTKRIKEEYPDLNVLSLKNGITNY